eukprot:TRINITY_DN11288_c0_g1_i1.p1 TRINITY_DN11288_c0_g1~~TRINITY_DN11288_c0_g1_i1.p1  ORF type:complete len:682 (+),score=122.74 TRINITY_DN11288_c0_g1_i1:248-2047(+)
MDASVTTERVLATFSCRWAVMLGICAGAQKSSVFGDVALVHRAIPVDEGGKVTPMKNADGTQTSQLQAEARSYECRDIVASWFNQIEKEASSSWKRFLEGETIPESPVFLCQTVLYALYRWPDRKLDMNDEQGTANFLTQCALRAESATVALKLCADALWIQLIDGKYCLTVLGEKWIVEEKSLAGFNQFPQTPRESKVVVGVMATCGTVKANMDDAEWKRIRSSIAQRKVEFIDNEIAAFYHAAKEDSNVLSFALKGVCDFGNNFKEDSAHTFAGKSSAAVLLRMIQKCLRAAAKAENVELSDVSELYPQIAQIAIDDKARQWLDNLATETGAWRDMTAQNKEYYADPKRSQQERLREAQKAVDEIKADIDSNAPWAVQVIQEKEITLHQQGTEFVKTMLAAHEQDMAQEVVFVDSSGISCAKANAIYAGTADVRNRHINDALGKEMLRQLQDYARGPIAAYSVTMNSSNVDEHVLTTGRGGKKTISTSRSHRIRKLEKAASQAGTADLSTSDGDVPVAELLRQIKSGTIESVEMCDTPDEYAVKLAKTPDTYRYIIPFDTLKGWAASSSKGGFYNSKIVKRRRGDGVLDKRAKRKTS